MLVAALVLATLPTVDYETVAKPLAAVLRDLSALSGVEMRASEALSEEMVVVRVKDVEIDTLRVRFAEVLHGKWTEDDGVFSLQQDERARTMRLRAVLDKRIAQIKKSVEGLPKIGNSIENMSKYHSSGHSYRAAYEIVSRMDLGDMASVPVGYRKVYSTNPNAVQVRISGLGDLVSAAQVEHNRIAEIARGLDIDEPAVGTPQYRTRQALIRKWEGPVAFQLVCSSHEDGLQGMARFVSGGEVLDVVPISFNWAHEAPLAFPTGVNQDSVIAFSKAATGMARLMAVNLWDGSTEIVKIEPEAIAALKKPTERDPLSLHYSEMLLETAKQANWQLVARVRDEMVPMLQNDKPTLRAALDAVAGSAYTSTTLAEGWLTIAPTELGNLVQIDRGELENFIERCAKRMPSLSDWGSLATKTPAPFTTALMMPYLKMAANDFGGGESQWLTYQLFDALTEQQKQIARTGGSIQIRSLLPAAKRLLSRFAFDLAHPQLLDAKTSSVVSTLESGPSTEMTDIFPNGLPDTFPVNFSTRSSFAVLPTPKTPDDLSPYPIPLSLLAYQATVDPKVFVNGVRPVFPTFRIGTMTRISFAVPVGETLQLQGFLYEYDIDRNSKVYEHSTAPKDFKDAYEKAIKERGG